MSGRTSWWPRDAAEHDRALLVELGEEFGPAAHAICGIIKDLAQAQRDEGRVLTGFRPLAAKGHLNVTLSAEDARGLARAIVERAGEIGWLDDLEIQEDGRRFTARVSGWEADQARGRESIKKATQRARPLVPQGGDMSPSNGDVSPLVPPTIEVTEKENTSDEMSADVRSVFSAWAASRTAATGRQSTVKLDQKRRRLIRAALKSHGLDDVLAAVQGWQHSPHHRGENQASTVYNDLSLLLRDAGRIEYFRDLHINASGGASVHQISETQEQRRRRLVAEAAVRNSRFDGGTPA